MLNFSTSQVLETLVLYLHPPLRPSLHPADHIDLTLTLWLHHCDSPLHLPVDDADRTPHYQKNRPCQKKGFKELVN